ncbi:MAG TPA: hypothetical protein DCM08_11330 [Microscillaceae bacterium]|jgi:hypothetical protein|nr:hypothetical protein [Microscillaceae bacterium]
MEKLEFFSLIATFSPILLASAFFGFRLVKDLAHEEIKKIYTAAAKRWLCYYVGGLLLLSGIYWFAGCDKPTTPLLGAKNTAPAYANIIHL